MAQYQVTPIGVIFITSPMSPVSSQVALMTVGRPTAGV